MSAIVPNVEDAIVLDKFQVRWYQREIYDSIMNAVYNKPGPRSFILCLPRRAGKDLLTWACVINKALSERCLIQYYHPTYSLARRALFDAITNDGDAFLDYLPKRLISSINQSLMRITLINGSIIQLQGAKDFSKSGVGVNPKMIVFSEYSKYASDEAFLYASPILAANRGILVIASTPSGRNFQYVLHEMAKTLPNWKTFHYKTSEIQHIPAEALAEQRQLLSPEMYEQEYECSYTRGIDSSIYGREMERLRQESHICPMLHQPEFPVHTAWDIGLGSKETGATAIVFFQVIGDGQIIRVIDCYTSTDIGLPSYINILKEKEYNYGLHFLPADGQVREWGNDAKSRIQMAEGLGFHFEILEQEKRVVDAIEATKVMMPRMWIDERKCRGLIEALDNYRRVWNDDRQMYEGILKNWTNHYADAFRYMVRAIPRISSGGVSTQDLDRARQEVMYGRSSQLPQLLDPNFNPRI